MRIQYFWHTKRFIREVWVSNISKFFEIAEIVYIILNYSKCTLIITISCRKIAFYFEILLNFYDQVSLWEKFKTLKRRLKRPFQENVPRTQAKRRDRVYQKRFENSSQNYHSRRAWRSTHWKIPKVELICFLGKEFLTTILRENVNETEGDTDEINFSLLYKESFC